MVIDLHVHTKELSSCSTVSIEEAIERYAKIGYDAIVVTNHLSKWSIGYREMESWESFIDGFMAPVKNAKEYGEKHGIKVFFGCELRFHDDGNDYLIYGITEEFLKNTPDIMAMGIGKLHSITKDLGFLIFQAHPFRNGQKITPPEYLDGIEVGNGHPRHNGRNDIARIWADAYGLLSAAGSDFHEEGDEGTGGILTFVDVKDEAGLCEVLKSKNYRLIMNCKGGLYL